MQRKSNEAARSRQQQSDQNENEDVLDLLQMVREQPAVIESPSNAATMNTQQQQEDNQQETTALSVIPKPKFKDIDALKADDRFGNLYKKAKNKKNNNQLKEAESKSVDDVVNYLIQFENTERLNNEDKVADEAKKREKEREEEAKKAERNAKESARAKVTNDAKKEIDKIKQAYERDAEKINSDTLTPIAEKEKQLKNAERIRDEKINEILNRRFNLTGEGDKTVKEIKKRLKKAKDKHDERKSKADEKFQKAVKGKKRNSAEYKKALEERNEAWEKSQETLNNVREQIFISGADNSLSTPTNAVTYEDWLAFFPEDKVEETEDKTWIDYTIPSWMLKSNGKNGDKRKLSNDEKIERAISNQAHDLEKVFERKVDVEANIENESEKTRSIIKAVKEQLNWILHGYIPLESQTIDSKGRIRFDEHTEKAIDGFMKRMNMTDHEKWLVFHMVAKRIGYSPDNSGKFLLHKVPDDLFIDALNDIEASIEREGHPYEMIEYRNRKYGGTQCFPIGIVNEVEAKMLTRAGGPLAGKTVQEVIEESRNYFVNYTLPEIRRNAHEQDRIKGDGSGTAQMYVLENYARALCSLDSVTPRYYNIAEAIDKGYDEIMRGLDPHNNPDMDEDVRQKRLEILNRYKRQYQRSAARLDKRQNRTKRYYTQDVYDTETGELKYKKGTRVEPDHNPMGGTYIELRNSALHPFEAACNYACNLAQFMGVVGLTPVIIGGYVEHFTNNIYAIQSNAMIGWTHAFWSTHLTHNQIDMKKYRPNKAMMRLAGTKEFLEAIRAWKVLLRVGGQDAVILYNNFYKDLTIPNVEQFLREKVNQESLSNNDTAQKIKGALKKINDITQYIMPGDLGFTKSDAHRFMENYMITQQMIAANGNKLEQSFTADEVYALMQSMGASKFMSSLTSSYAGREAAIMMRNTTIARETPLSHAVDTILRRSGITKLVLTMGIDTYFLYGVNMIQAMIPMSSTISYLAVRFGNRYVLGNGRENPEADILNYQMGGHDQFGQGLVKNFLYDFTKILNIGGFAFFCYLIIYEFLGFEPPEDPAFRYNIEEWRIGHKINLGGEGVGIPIFQAWWLDDITLFGRPLMYAFCIHRYYNDHHNLPRQAIDIAWKAFNEGCWDVVSGASMFDLVHAIQNATGICNQYEQMLENPKFTEHNTMADFMYMNFFELPLAKAAGKMFVPNFIKEALKDKYEHTAYYVYDRDSEYPMKTEQVTDWADLQRRIESRYNPLYAVFNNLFQNHYFTDDGKTQKTGYLLKEMPYETTPDPYRTAFMVKLKDETGYNLLENYKQENPEDTEGIEQMYVDVFQKLEDIMAGYDWDVNKAVAQGFWMDPEMRWEFAKYCTRNQNYAKNTYYDLRDKGIKGEALTNAYNEYQDTWNFYKDIKDNWIFDTETVPWSDAGYIKLRTDYATVYQRKSTGQPVSWQERLLEGPSDIDAIKYPKGNIPNQLAPFTVPETEGRGFNYETILSWYDPELTDINTVLENAEGTQVQKGFNRGLPLDSAIMGGSPNFATEELRDENGAANPNSRLLNVYQSSIFRAKEPTINQRSWVPFEEKFLFDLPNYNGFKSPIEELGSNGREQETDKNKGTTTMDGKNTLRDMLMQVDYANIGGGIYGELGNYIPSSQWSSSSSKPSWSSYSYGGSRSYTPRSYSYNNGGNRSNYSPSYSSSYSGGGGGGSYSSNYNPKIYNMHVSGTPTQVQKVSGNHTNINPRSVNFDRAYGMNARQPQDAMVNYLRPGFETKGSREAYKRQDI